MNEQQTLKFPDPADPAAHATLEDKRIAFEWLRSVAISESENAQHAAVIMYEISYYAKQPF